MFRMGSPAIRAVSLAIVAVLGAGCASTPSPSDPARVLPSNPSAASAGTSSPGPEGAMVVRAIDREFTTPLLDASTDGHEIVWSRGAGTSTSAPDLYRYVPDGPPPEVAFRNPDRNSTLELVTVHGGRYAFAEEDPKRDGENGYRMWLLPAIGGQPILVDQGDWQPADPVPPLPLMVLTTDRLIWTAVHHEKTGLQFQLLSYSITSGRRETLLSSDARQVEYWFPSADDTGTRVVYATVEHSNRSEEFYVYLLDLAAGGPPRRLDPDGAATWPAISGDTVVWKQANRNVLDAGSLMRTSLSQPGAPVVEMTDLSTRANDPSAGTRFVAAWRDHDTDLVVFDLRTNRPLTIETIPTGVQEGLERPVVSGDLLVFVRAFFDVQPLELCWVRLPA